MALAIAEKVTKLSSRGNYEIARDNVKAALALVTKTTDLVVRVNAQDVKHLEELAASPDNVLGKYKRIRFETDESIEAGGCVLDSESGRVDGQLQNQIDRLANELLVELSPEGNEL